VPSDTARATRALALIRRMYAIEERAREAKLDPAELEALRQRETSPILAGIRALLDQLAPHVQPKRELGKAVGYANKQ
jgi:transposase